MSFVASVVVLLSMLVTVGPPHATYRGKNGRLAYTFRKHGIWQVFSMKPDGTGIRQITHFKTPQSTGSPNWSPDGTKIAFDNDGTGDDEIWTINADGSGLRQITHDPKTSDGSPVWSPDGTQILFERYSPLTDRTAIYQIGADGKGMTKLTGARVDHESPLFTPDGSQITYVAFGDAGGICELWTMNPDGSGKTLLVPADARLEINDMSPNGKKLLVTDNCAGPLPQSLYLMNFNGSGMTRLTDAGCCYQDGFAEFSPDGTKIVFLSNRVVPGFNTNLKEIYEMNADGSNMVQITSTAQFGGLDWGAAPG